MPLEVWSETRVKFQTDLRPARNEVTENLFTR